MKTFSALLGTVFVLAGVSAHSQQCTTQSISFLADPVIDDCSRFPRIGRQQLLTCENGKGSLTGDAAPRALLFRAELLWASRTDELNFTDGNTTTEILELDLVGLTFSWKRFSTSMTGRNELFRMQCQGILTFTK